jgi:hypothetical protein
MRVVVADDLMLTREGITRLLTDVGVDVAPPDFVAFANDRVNENSIDRAVIIGSRLREPTTRLSDWPSAPSDDETTSMRTRSLLSAGMAHCCWMASEFQKSNA